MGASGSTGWSRRNCREISDWILPYRGFWQASLGNLKNYLENE